MKRSLRHLIAVRATLLGALLAGCATAGFAQRAKGTGPPITTRGAVQSNPKADKGQANAEAKRTEARADKAAREADKAARDAAKAAKAAEHAAWKDARGEPTALLRGIRLSAAEQASLATVRNRYADELRALEKQEEAEERAAYERRRVVARIDAIRLRERAELRSRLTAVQQAQYDRNLISRALGKS